MHTYLGSEFKPPKPSVAQWKVKTASTSHCCGLMVVKDEDVGRIVQFESHLEMLWLLYILSLPEVASVREQVHFVWFDENGEPQNKYFDFVAILHDGRKIACEVKPTVRLRSGKVMHVLRQIAAQLGDEYVSLRILTEQNLDKIGLHNAELFQAMSLPDPEADDLAVAVANSLVGSARLEDMVHQIGLQGRGMRALVRLIASRKLVLCSHVKISMSAMVRKPEGV